MLGHRQHRGTSHERMALSLRIELNFFPQLIALLVAYLLALPIGWDREQHAECGPRTFPLVAIAACGLIQASEKITLGNAKAIARVLGR